MPHIALGDTADLFLIAPATANIIAKIAHGIADDALTTLACSSRAPIVVAPAMDDEMIRREVVHQNLSLIVRRGGFVIPPGEGELASGHVGPGRLADPQRIVRVALEMAARGRELAGKRVLVTAGATEEPWDPARHLSSPSSGRMGYALAEEARRRGAQVVLVTGTPKAPLPGGVEVVRVRTAEEMRRAVLDALPSANVLLMAAAVSDYRPERTEPEKIKKSGEPVTLTLVPNPDILEEAGRAKGARVHVGFSVATGDAVAEARDKLGKKNLDLVVSNDPNEKGAAFGGSTNRVTLVPAKGEPIELPLMSKDEVARAVLDEVGRLLVRGTGS
jgi:phosphopantothenoylcysteine decarboxylase/phosphopantothenate--cysteine ligase